MFEPRSWRGVLDTTLCDKVCQWLTAGWWFSSGTPVSSTNKTWPPWYNWNIVESGVKHHNPNPLNSLICPVVSCTHFFLSRRTRHLFFYVFKFWALHRNCKRVRVGKVHVLLLPITDRLQQFEDYVMLSKFLYCRITMYQIII